ncbi:MAG: DUF3108 domain-containing protein [Xanthomonadales bacterium]|nr:DUF3108 domain-containing protein [Xanthomonadales bacterium]MBK7146644.1 DUF3108 domain-containing protein [Xanthomonadales bacterium]MCC6562777.1 DUF3108 domain-containing protein [Xanthomonadales bacterium]
MIRILAALILLGTAVTRADDAEPIAPFHSDYQLIREGKHIGEASIELIMGKDGFQFSTRSEGTEGLAGFAGVRIEENSTFRWQDGRPETLHYRYFQKAAWKKRSRSVDVDPEARRIDATDNDGSAALDYAPATVDRNLVVLALAADLKARREKLEYRVADKRAIETHRYQATGHETIETARGRFDCIRVERIREKPGRTTTTWIAPALGYTPVRILQKEPDGETLEMLLR